MSFKKSIKKTKKLFLKTLQNLKKFPLVSHDHNLPKTIFLNPISCTTIKQTPPIPTHPFTNHGRDTSENPMKNTIKTCHVYNNTTKDDFKSDTIKPTLKPSHVNNGTTKDDLTNVKMKQVLPVSKTEPKSTNSSFRFASDGPYILAQKMKELDMIEVEEVDHVLDVEEALNYYSRLSCPVYVEIVDKFFLDMYDEFLLPQPSVNLNSSSRRLGPLKL